jgi:hypothetical protein
MPLGRYKVLVPVFNLKRIPQRLRVFPESLLVKVRVFSTVLKRSESPNEPLSILKGIHNYLIIFMDDLHQGIINWVRLT